MLFKETIWCAMHLSRISTIFLSWLRHWSLIFASGQAEISGVIHAQHYIHRLQAAHFKVQLTESLSNLLSLKEVYFDPHLSNWQWSEIFTKLLLAVSSFFKARKFMNIFWLQLKIAWRALDLHRNGIFTYNQSFSKSKPNLFLVGEFHSLI